MILVYFHYKVIDVVTGVLIMHACWRCMSVGGDVVVIDNDGHDDNDDGDGDIMIRWWW